jgi:hypothetical protein
MAQADEVRRCPASPASPTIGGLVVKNRRGMGQATICDLCHRLMTQRQWFDALFGGER